MLKKRRRQHRLDQLEIPTSEVEITDEVLGRGGFGTVYLADLNGLNAAAKVIVFEDNTYEDEDEDEDEDVDCGDKGHRQHLKPGTPTAAEASAANDKRDQTEIQTSSTTQSTTQSTAPPSPQQSREHQQQRRAFMRELEAMKRLRGPHTVTIYGAVTSLPDRLVLVSE